MRQCEFKKHYDPKTDTHVRKHIYGEGIFDVFKSVGRKLTGKTAKKLATKAASKATKVAATKTGEYAGKKAGDKIVELLSKDKSKPPTTKQIEPLTTVTTKQIEPLTTVTEIESPPTTTKPKSKELSSQEVNARVNQILSGGKLRRRNFI